MEIEGPPAPVNKHYGATSTTDQPITSHYELQNDPTSPTERFDDEDEDDDFDDDNEMSLAELLYSSASYHAIAKPGKYCMHTFEFSLYVTLRVSDICI